MLKIYLIRHGQTDWNKIGKIMGDKDIPLNKTGISQVKESAKYLKGKDISKIFSSPVLRCMETSRIISKTIRAEIIQEKGFKEIGFGDWVGEIYDELKKAPDFKPYYLFPEERTIPNGERFIDSQKRIIGALESLIGSEKEDFGIISHADPIKIIVCHILGCPIQSVNRFDIDNASISCINHTNRLKIELLNFKPYQE